MSEENITKLNLGEFHAQFTVSTDAGSKYENNVFCSIVSWRRWNILFKFSIKRSSDDCTMIRVNYRLGVLLEPWADVN